MDTVFIDLQEIRDIVPDSEVGGVRSTYAVYVEISPMNPLLLSGILPDILAVTGAVGRKQWNEDYMSVRLHIMPKTVDGEPAQIEFVNP